MDNTCNIPSRRIEDELAKYGSCATNTVGTSMEPLFKTHRDVVVFEPISRDIKKYDVVLYRRPDEKCVLHRVIGEKDGVFIIRGDNTFVKENVPREWIIAIAVSFNRNGKRRKVTDLSYRIYSRLWHCIYPLRFVLFKTRRFLSKIKHKIKG